jgi:ATP adenylyltransferase
MPLRYHNLFSPLKMSYIKGDRPRVDCILCAILRGDPQVDSLLVYRGEHAFVSVNKYPYNSGHLLICPKRHIADYRETSGREEREMHGLVRRCLDVLDELYHPSGFNVGFNMGEFAGASQEHLHLHLIPRYRNELGFVDIVGGAKILVEDPEQTMLRLRTALEGA